MSKNSVVKELERIKITVDNLPKSSPSYAQWEDYVDNARHSLSIALEMQEVKDEAYLQGVVDRVRKRLKNVNVHV